MFKLIDCEVKEILTSLPQDYVDWGTKLIGADTAWKKYRGRGIKVGIIDTGIDYTHPDLVVKECISFIDNTDGFDSGFHGTHVAGIIAGRDNGVGIIGVAPEAEIYSAKIFDSQGKTTTTALFNAFRWMIEKKVHVINMSFGALYPPDVPGVADFLEEYHRRIKEMHAVGIILVAAAGNSGNPKDNLDRISYPARFPEVFAVGAISQELQRADFSSTGPDLDFAMPGVDVYSCYPNNRWARLSGTSMASPYLAGCISLLQEYALKTKDRLFTYDEIKKELIKYSVDLGVEGIDHEFGYGKINIGQIGSAIMRRTTMEIDQPLIYNRETWRVLAPLRFVVEVNGGQILDWDSKSETVIFKTAMGQTVTMQVDNPVVTIESE